MSLYDDASLALLTGAGAGKDGKLYVTKPTDGSEDFTFSRGSNLSATRVNSDGLIEKGRENLLLQSNTFSDTAWADLYTAYTRTGGQAGYDGSNDAWELSKASASNGYITQAVAAANSVYTFSIHAKSGSQNGLILFFGTPVLSVNLDTGENFGLNRSIINSSITSVGNGWWKIEFTFLASGTDISLKIMDADTNTNVAGSIYVQDAQLELGLAATDYIESGASTGKAGVLENEPRFDYSGGATCPSLLLEWSRTNLIPYSEALLSYNQFKVIGSETTIGYTSDTTPEGITSPITTISETATTGNHRAFFEDIDPCTIGSTYSFSVFAKSIGGRNIRIGDGGKGFEADTIVDLSDGTVLTDVDNNVTVNAYGNGWYRISVSGTNNSIYATQRFFINSVDGTTLSFAGDVSKGVLLWGAQFEEGGYPTSYIPNHSGGSVTRSSEASAFELSVLDFFGLSNTESGTFLIETKFIKPSSNLFVDMFSQGGSGVNAWTGSTFPIRDTGGSNNFTVQHISSVVDDYIKIIIRRNLTTFNVFINGVKSSTTATITNPLQWFDHIALYRNSQIVKQIVEFPEALTDVECIKLTEL